jgi:dTDP-4-amino-4,6-dideoxygalactose transaminase
MLDYIGWHRDYYENEKDYNNIFNRVMHGNKPKETLEEVMTYITGRKYAVSVGSATDGLHFALRAYGIGPGDEVLVTNFSFIASASIISAAGAIPVFCDIDLDTYHISFDSIQRMVSDKTKALIYTPLFGNMTDSSEIEAFCKDNDILFIEDAAQSLGTSLNHIKSGTIGACSIISFNENKVIPGINGGGIFLTDNKEIADRVRKIRRHGQGDIQGFNSRTYDLNEQILIYRLGKMEKLQKTRQMIASVYNQALEDMPVHIQKPTEWQNHNYHKYVVRFEDHDTREMARKALKASVHYETPIAEHPMYGNILHRKDNCVNTHEACRTVLTLPCHPWMIEPEIYEIIDTLEMIV